MKNIASRISLACFLAVVALTFSMLGSASAYVFERSSWPFGTVPMRVQVGPASIALADGSKDWNSVVVNALALWNEQMAGMQFTSTVVPAGTAAAAGDGINSIQFSSTVYGEPFGSSVLAITLVNYAGSESIESDVLFNTANRFNSYRGSYAVFNGISYFDLHRIALHELGHVLGLDHPDEGGQTVTALMNAYVSAIDSIQADDIAGAAALYGAPPNPPAPTGNGQILQISTRGSVGTGPNVMIGGFIIQDATKRVIVRAIGPSLGAFGVANALANPVLELHDSTGAVISTNDDWRATQEQEISDTKLAPTNNLESAIVADLAPGSYTAIVTGAAGGSGVALVEVYDLEAASGKLGNISTRAHIGAADDVMIGGFIISGPQTQKNVIRALGPSLGAVGVQGPLANPLLELYNSNGQLLQSNDDFSTNRDAGVIYGYGLGPTNGFESGLYFEGAPGNFTVIMRGVGGATGVGLIEVYAVK
ncbi:MAG: matrixin family metalloprotease [Spartobacteria bacterium]